jgi:hypothetical protein
MAEENWKSIDKQVKDWAAQKSNVEQQITRLNAKTSDLESEIEVILMERIRDKPNAERYDRMLEKREQIILEAREQIANYQDMDAAVKKKKAEIKHGIELLDEIIAGGGISDTHLRMLVDEIIVDEVDGKLSIEVCLKAAFRRHYDVYDEFMELIETGGDVSFDITPYLQNRVPLEA